jgi:hypothetical protein
LKPQRRIGSAFDKYFIGLGFYMSQEFINANSMPNSGNTDPLSTAFANVANNLFSFPTSNSASSTLVEVINSTNESTPTGNTNNLNIGNVYITNKFDSRANNPVLIRQKQRVTKPTATTSTALTTIEAPSSILTFGPYGNQEYINIGESPNDGNGDPLRTAFYKINNNFSNLFLTSTTTSTAYTSGLSGNQVIFEVPIARFYQGEFQIRSSDAGTPDMQDITLSASITNNLAGVRFSGHSTLFEGNAICRYDMAISGANVRILINPLVDAYLEHFISAFVTYPEAVVTVGVDIALDGYANGYLMGTEDGLILTTES